MARRAMNPRSLDNLNRGAVTRFSGETAGKAGHKGAVSEKRRRAKEIRYCLEYLLTRKTQVETPDGETVSMTGAEQIAAALFEKALAGDVRAFEMIRDTVGQKPAERIQFEEVDAETMDEVARMVEAAAREA